MEPAVRIASLAKDHAGERALRGISLDIPDPCLFGIIGADGAGKSTLMNILATLTDADSGSVRALGRDLAEEFPAIRKDIGYMPQRFSLYQDLSVGENLDFFADIFGISGKAKADRMDHLLAFAGLQTFKNRRAGLLSGGMKQKLALACTLIHHPKLLLLDEPTVGVDPVARRDFWSMLKSLRADGITLVVSTPYMDEASLCDSLVLLHEGGILAQGPPAQLVAAYPFDLFRVEASPEARVTTLNYPGSQEPPPGFALVYPSGGSLHAAESLTASRRDGAAVTAEATSEIPGVQSEDRFRRLRSAIPQAHTVTRIEPALEDCFFALLSGRMRMGPKLPPDPAPAEAPPGGES